MFIAIVACASVQICGAIRLWNRAFVHVTDFTSHWLFVCCLLQCKVCMQTFMCTTSEVKCREHAEAKHPKSDVSACFPHLKKWWVTCKFKQLGKCYTVYVKCLLLCLGILLGPKLLVGSCGCSCQSKWGQMEGEERSISLSCFLYVQFKCYHFVDSYISTSHE